MDLRSPYVISIVDLPRQEGASRDFQFDFLAPDDCGVQLLAVPAGTVMATDLTLQSVSEGVLVHGRVRALAQGRCSRCLREIELDLDEAVAELVYYPERKQALLAEDDEEAEDFPVIKDDRIDLEPILRDALVLAMPFTPLCAPDCAGLCPDCGQMWRDLPKDHHHEQLDPRFAALDALRAQFVDEIDNGGK
ncbi:YceD family protein [Arcanobacterium hippocoleae]|uniref:DUF177 domain-containing protein n=1 Tax=Arcanobacterium hippocoleae TaxID=149017 RepID=A0ABU1T410_9ACTO|nr:DUF177 domain-containing protein [Arcanobacterium hippocoleae]MDR6940127.1 uncharacterized protein [Arcanobacterium hippocoleae]